MGSSQNKTPIKPEEEDKNFVFKEMVKKSMSSVYDHYKIR